MIIIIQNIVIVMVVVMVKWLDVKIYIVKKNGFIVNVLMIKIIWIKIIGIVKIVRNLLRSLRKVG